ncbi:Nuclear pore complex protein [Capsicum baccatum]|uniref:Nuclear pore complex protein n=1 Tax=Capsicum baccatum TaxID=33114 RepID=A0A2G2WCW4_CAPBA|nr:Nuclear pore complex protein [Capsicum baccatum]
MFSPGTKRSNLNARKSGRDKPTTTTTSSSPVTPLTQNRRPLDDNSPIPNRPSTGTPAPWASRLSALARIPPAKKSDKGEETDPIQPVYVGDFPQVLRDEQAVLIQKHAPGNVPISGGMDKETSLTWVICGNKLFVWSYLSPAASKNCIVLDLPLTMSENEDVGKSSNDWLVCFINWDRSTNKVSPQCCSAGVVACNRKTRNLIYWPDIYSAARNEPVVSFPEESEVSFSTSDVKGTPTKLRQQNKLGSNVTRSNSLNCLIACAVPKTHHSHASVALACSSDGELWQFVCSPSGIQRRKISQDMLSKSSQGSDGGQFSGGRGYPRSLVWQSLSHSSDKANRQFLLLTDHEIQCFSIEFSPSFNVSKIWTHEIVGTDGDLGIQKDLAGQKRIWPLNLQIDNDGKVITILIAIFCKDRVTSSSYTEYSLLTMQYKSGVNVSSECVQPHERVLEKKAPIQVIIPKARFEDEEFLFSMRLKVGGKPAGSEIILAGDGTATVSHYWRNSTRLYQFDLPYDAGRVLDASVFPSDDGEDGAWAVLTEKAGVWAIPERAVLLGGVEPPERSLSRKGSSNERSSLEERKNLSFTGNIAPRRATSEAWDSGDRQRTGLTGIARRSAQDEEAETLLNQLFHDFLLSGHTDGAFDKLKTSGAFEREGETNVFARTSKSIVDTLAKHWTTTKGAEIVTSSVVSSQLLEKQQKHKRFLQFLALSKCHEELCSRQRHALHIIMEHGEKLAGMIQLRELQNMLNQNRASGAGTYSTTEMSASGSLWDVIQLVGERARRRTVLLMDRDNAEVFYSKVSDLEEFFYCLERDLDYIISEKMTDSVLFQRAYELSSACVTLLRTAMTCRNEDHLWYPPSEGLTPWTCQEKVRNGLWSLAYFMLQLVKENNSLDDTIKLDSHAHLEVLSDVLLEAYSGAINAKVERGEGHKNLLDEYCNRRDALLECLYQQVKDLVEGKLQDLGEAAEEQKIFGKLSSGLLSIAKRHEGYKTLWSICCDLNNSELLKNLMHDSTGPKRGFSYFVFQQLYDNRQFSKLMRLGEEFQEDLAIFLKQHQDLLWLHEIFLHQFYEASENLHVLALSPKDTSAMEIEAESFDTTIETGLVERRRFLNLSKVAALAGRSANFETKVKQIEADLKILNLQEEIMKLLPDGERQNISQRLLPPVDLIELCLKIQDRELSLRVFDIFAWTSSSFIKSNASLLEDCWRNASNQDDWERLYQASVDEGWGDEETLSILKDTILFQASSRCYGPKAETFEGNFQEALPLRPENSEQVTLKNMGSSVETILMQHKDYPEAGKLMLTAVMLGSVHSNTISIVEEEEPTPME